MLPVSHLQLLDKNALLSLVKEALGVDEVLCGYFDRLAPLKGVFEKYSVSDGVVDTMTVREEDWVERREDDGGNGYSMRCCKCTWVLRGGVREMPDKR